MKQIKIFLPALLMFLGSGFATASDYGVCKEIQWQPYQTYTIRAALHQRVHVILPEPIQGDPVPGSPQLWDIDGENIHLFIKPKNLGNREGGVTTVTAISKLNTSFDFKVIRVKSNPDICIRIVKEGGASNGKIQGWATPEERVNVALESELRMANAKLIQSKKDQVLMVEDSLMAYRSNIFTGYTWSSGGAFFGGNDVSDVWDDGRFTYVRLTEPNKGILTVTAVVNEKEEMADYKYEPSTHIYMITGLFPSFILRYDDSAITVTRRSKGGS